MAHSKWAAWQQVVLDQVDDVVDHIVEFFEPEPTKPEEVVAASEPDIDQETGEIKNVEYSVDLIKAEEIVISEPVSTPKPKKGAKA